MSDIFIITAVFTVSFLLTGLFISGILRFSFRNRIFDTHDDRKLHRGDVPRLGGLSFVPAIVIAISFVYALTGILGNIFPALSTARVFFESHIPSASLLPLSVTICAMGLLYLTGMAYDLSGLRYQTKFMAQLAAGILIAAGGFRIETLSGVFNVYTLSPLASYALTTFIVVFVTNAINLIDGIDGLASGLSAIAMALYAIIFISCGDLTGAILATAALGTLIPFFCYNSFGSIASHRKIFMGDTGSLTTGLLLSFLAIRLCGYEGQFSSSADIIVAAFSPLAIPCLDVVRVFFHRITRGRSPFLPDRIHIHHKLMLIGLSSKATMVLLLCMSVAVAAANILLSTTISIPAIIAIDISLWIALNLLLTHRIRTLQHSGAIPNDYD